MADAADTMEDVTVANSGTAPMACDFPGNCPGGAPAEFRVNKGSSGFDIKHTGELPYADGEPVGAFRTVCEVSHFAYADPIVFPGQASKGHLHMFFGNTGITGHSTYASLRSSGNGTCRGGIANRSGYWVPAVLDGHGTPQLPKVIHVYYKSGYRISDPTDVTVIPDGLKMLVGDAKATTPQPLNNVYWTCNGKKSASMGDCHGELVMEVHFKQCASGALDSPDHKSHVSDPVNGACSDPAYPLTLPVITYRVVYEVSGTADWRLSSDMYPVSNGNGGYSLHGDWMDGWDPQIKRTWTKHCASNPGMSCGSHILGDGRVMFMGDVTGTPDGGTGTPDGGTGSPDGGTGSPDGGTGSPDGGTDTPDSGTGTPDGGTGTPDGGTGTPDGGTGTPDGGAGTPDGGTTPIACEFPGNCPGGAPAEFRVNAGSPGFDVVHTGERPRTGGGPVGAFRTVCEVSHFAYADPIVFPGQASKGHLHMFFGNTGITGHSTYASLRSSGNGTCRGGIANRSGYWVPAVLDGSGTPQVPKVIHVYYKSGYSIRDATDVAVIPDGLKMLVGNAKATTPQSTANVYWRCNEGKRTASMGDCYGELMMGVTFQQCASGALDSSDHKSHLSNPTNGACSDPAYPVTLPKITYQVIYTVNGTSNWRLSSDMYPVSNGNGGYSLHGDWMDGWDPEIKRTWTEHCTSKPGKDCGSHILGDGRVIF